MTNLEEFNLIMDTMKEIDKINDIIDDVIEMLHFRTGGDNERSYSMIMAMLSSIIDVTSFKFEVEPELTRSRFISIGADVDEAIEAIEAIEKGEP